jgi:LysR family transcriptional regulator, transcriptional activator of the cysJI operon
MQIEIFKIFCDLAETCSFSKAAAANNITQSAVSQQIRGLEERFKVKLVERGRRHFSLTPEGRAFLESSREILNTFNHLGDRIQELQNVVSGDIKIAVIYSIGLHELPPFLKAFKKKYPQVEVRVEYHRSPQVYLKVLNGEADLGLISFPATRRGLIVEPFLRDKLVLICPPNHKLASKQSVSVSEIEGERFISFEPDTPTRKVIDRHLKDQGVAVRQEMEFDNIETVKRAVEIEHGISIVPQKTVTQEIENGSLVAVEIEKPELWRPLGIILKRNRARSPALKEFIALLQKNQPFAKS